MGEGTIAAPVVIALDGPAASGKTTVGRVVAAALGYPYLDTGVLYRALTWAALQSGTNLADGGALAGLAAHLALAHGAAEVGGSALLETMLDGRRVGKALHTREVDEAVSGVAAIPEVRAALRPVQRSAIRPPGVVLAGRDIGTVIAPDADVKVWLDASAAERARRRAGQLNEAYETVLAQLVARDTVDGTRAVAPMRAPPDAVIVNTDGLSVEAVVQQVLAHVPPRAMHRL